MRYFFLSIVAIVSLFIGATDAHAAYKPTPGYIFGFAASFNDSTVYFTEIQRIDSTWTDARKDFLYRRNDYSSQLREHLKQDGFVNPTCVTIFSGDRKKVEKKYLKLRKKYTQKGNFDVKYVTLNTFSYHAIIPDESEMVTTKNDIKKARKAEIKAEKENAKKKKALDKEHKKKK
ncbi:MAG: hypothetical protein IKW98_07230 [Prevotella sp.]|nr:hypothetical protein [Prevotella sp.]